MVKSLANQLRSHKLASLMLLVCALGVYFQGRMYQVIADDAYISFTYAKHLVAGEGLVFNPGFTTISNSFRWRTISTNHRLRSAWWRQEP